MRAKAQRSCGCCQTPRRACADRRRSWEGHALRLGKHAPLRRFCGAFGRLGSLELDQTVQEDVWSGSSWTLSGLFLKLQIIQEIRKSGEKLLQLCRGEKEVISFAELIRHREKKLQLSLYLLSYIIFWTTKNLFLVPFSPERLIMNNSVF